jgi:hypothetical protein
MATFKLTKQESEEHAELTDALRVALGALDDAVRVYNEALTALNDPLVKAIADYNEALQATQRFAEDIASQADSDISDKSDKWQEGDKGRAAVAWKDEWENFAQSVSDLEVEMASEVTADDPGDLDTFENLTPAAVE